MSVTLTSARPRGPVLALDLGGTNARAAVVTPDGILDESPLGRRPRWRRARQAVVDYCAERSWTRPVAEHLAAGGAAPVAIGICAPGPLDARTGALIDPPNLRDEWWGFPLAPDAGRAFRRCPGRSRRTRTSRPRRGGLRGRPGLRRPRLPHGLDRHRRRRPHRRAAADRPGRRRRRARAPDGRHGRRRCAAAARAATSSDSPRGTGIAHAARDALEAARAGSESCGASPTRSRPRPLSAADVARRRGLGRSGRRRHHRACAASRGRRWSPSWTSSTPTR